MKAMKAMKCRKKSPAQQIAAMSNLKFGRRFLLKPRDVLDLFEGIFNLALDQMNKSGSFNLVGMLHLKPKVIPGTEEHWIVNPNTGNPCIVVAKPARTTVTTKPLAKLRHMIALRDRM